MKLQASSPPSTYRYEIKYDPMVGFYLYVFEGDKCIHDYLQDTLDLAMECAWEDFGVPKSAWKKFESYNIFPQNKGNRQT